MEQILPIKINALHQVPAYYEQKIKIANNNIILMTIVFFCLAALIAVLAYFQIFSMEMSSMKNLEIFALFPDEHIENLSKKL